MADIREVERQMQFYYCCKELKRHGLKINFGRLDAYEVLSRSHNSVVCVAETLDELQGFCNVLEDTSAAKGRAPEVPTNI